MIYQFATHTILSLRTAFSDFQLYREKPRANPYRCWDYLFLQFKNPVTLCARDPSIIGEDLADIIFAGDNALTKHYQHHFGENTQLEMGLRWIGSSDGERLIQATGFAIKLSYPSNVKSPYNQEVLVGLLIKADLLITDDLRLSLFKQETDLSSTVSTTESKTTNSCCFFKKNPKSNSALNRVKDYLFKKINPIKPRYRRDSETGMNPCYQTIDTIEDPLKINQKRIWLLRSDGSFSIGIKNAYWISFGENELARATPDSLYQYINWDDRAGHPSLAISDNEYDGSALYGGYICQKLNYLQVFTSSGRYYREDLKIEEKRLLEAYIAFQFQQSFGEQDIIFYEGPYKDFYELSLFFANRSFPKSMTERVYTTSVIKEILDSVPLDHAFYSDKFFSNYIEALREGEDSTIGRYWNSY